MHPNRLRSIVESLVFASDKPVTVKQLREVIELEHGVKLENLETDLQLEMLSEEERERVSDPVRAAVNDLLQRYGDPERGHARGFTLVEVAGGLQFRTVAENAGFVRRLYTKRPQRLTRAAIETLAIVAYRQPVTRPEIEEIRGVDSGATLKNLMERKLIKILGRKEDVGRPTVYGTTNEFLEFFQLKSLSSLPTLREFQELSAEHQQQVDAFDQATSGGAAKPTPLAELREGQPVFSPDDDGSLEALEQAMHRANRVAQEVGATIEPEPPAAPGEEAPGETQ